MWAIFNFDDPNQRYNRFLKEAKPKFQSFIESIILHEQIIVPTDDFMSLAILLGVLGQDSVIELMDNGVLGFLRIKGALSYIGNGGGLQAYEILTKEKEHQPFCSPKEDAIKWAISELNSQIDLDTVTQKVLKVTQELDLSDIKDEIRHETYMDVLKSQYLRAHFLIRSDNMDRLSGIGPDVVRVFGGHEVKVERSDEVSTILMLAHANVELRGAEYVGCDDSSTLSPVGHLLKAKQERVQLDLPSDDAFVIFREISGIPDIGELVLSKKLKISDLIRLRKSRNGQQFRQWFHENCRQDPVRTGREYSLLLKDVPAIQAEGSRIIRFLVTLAVGLINPIASVLTGLTDSFVLDRILRGVSPKFFIERLDKLSKISAG